MKLAGLIVRSNAGSKAELARAEFQFARLIARNCIMQEIISPKLTIDKDKLGYSFPQMPSGQEPNLQQETSVTRS